jgi:hypothetical protein
MDIVFNLLIFALMICTLQLAWMLSIYSIGLLSDVALKVRRLFKEW